MKRKASIYNSRQSQERPLNGPPQCHDWPSDFKRLVKQGPEETFVPPHGGIGPTNRLRFYDFSCCQILPVIQSQMSRAKQTLFLQQKEEG